MRLLRHQLRVGLEGRRARPRPGPPAPAWPLRDCRAAASGPGAAPRRARGEPGLGHRLAALLLGFLDGGLDAFHAVFSSKGPAGRLRPVRISYRLRAPAATGVTGVEITGAGTPDPSPTLARMVANSRSSGIQ